MARTLVDMVICAVMAFGVATVASHVTTAGMCLLNAQGCSALLRWFRMVSYNIGHLAYLNAKRYGLSRVLFGGFFIRGHPYTMETISFAIKFWSKVSRRALSGMLH